MLPLLLLLADADAMIAVARAATAPERCRYDGAGTDITVCGMRHADRYRLPLVVRDPGDPRGESVHAERTRLLARTTPIQEMSPFLVGGGLAGVHARVGGDGKVSGGLRQLAP